MTIEFKKRGGKRPGAGRPPKGSRSSERHKTRPFHNRRYPVHVTIRVAHDIGYLRRRDTWLAVREAAIMTTKRFDFRIVHMSVQADHIHLIIEAENKVALAKGMQGFQGSAAKHINAAITKRTGKRRRGAVFPDRYHARVLRTPREVHSTINYVLNNWRHHGEDLSDRAATWMIDPYSTGISFWGWKELVGSPSMFRAPSSYMAILTWIPKTWLLRYSWEKYPPISAYSIPGRRA
ncbi:MAG TPA: transposase [Kofleriaceae bacterium]|nr:transposase [Kofleriaceae bacterium]